MKRLLSVAVTLACALQGFAAGLIIVGDEEFWRGSTPIIIPPGRPPWPEPRPEPPPERRIIPPRPRPSVAPLEISFTKVDAKIRNQVATTTVEQEFYNPNNQRLEGTFLFPVPKGAHIDKFTMLINGKPAEAELLAAEKARAIYEDIVRRQRDPALLEYAGRDLFRVRIFPIEPAERKRITLTYAQVLKVDAGLVSYVVPMNTEKFTAKPMRNISLKVSLESRQSLRSIYSPSHSVDVKRDGSHQAVIGFEARDARPDADFQLFYTVSEADLGINLLTYKPPGEDGYFLLLASPGIEARDVKVIPKDVVFVLDTSGSMAGAKLEQAKKALAFCTENLNESDRFEVMRFSTEVEPVFEKLSAASEENRRKAQKFVSSMKPIGGTAIDDALKRAVSLRPESGVRPYVIVFLTDGRPTVGNINPDQIVENATKSKTGLTRIFCFGIGTDVNTHLLDRIAEQTKSFSQYVLPEEDIEVKVSSFFTKIKEPVLANPRIEFPGQVRTSKLHPSPLPDLFKGEQLILVGRYSGSGDGAVVVEGSVNGETRKCAYDVIFPRDAGDHDFIPRLWATRRVGYLLDEIRLHGDNKELKDEVTELARKYGIVTPYTAYLINEDEVRRNVPLSMQSLPEIRRNSYAYAGADRFSQMKSVTTGDAAVSDARGLNALKEAAAPRSAITANNAELYRALPRREQEEAARAAGVPLSAPAGGAAGPSAAQQQVQVAAALEQQSRFVGGRNFFQNGSQWIDTEVQKRAGAQHLRLQFGSEGYFKLANTNATARQWLALGRNVQFVLNDTIFEVVD